MVTLFTSAAAEAEPEGRGNAHWWDTPADVDRQAHYVQHLFNMETLEVKKAAVTLLEKNDRIPAKFLLVLMLNVLI